MREPESRPRVFADFAAYLPQQNWSPTTYTAVRANKARGAIDDQDDTFYYPAEWDQQDLRTSVADAIRGHRMARDLTRGELARMLGCTEATVCRYEDGEQIPSPQRLQQLQQLLDVDPEGSYQELPEL